MKGQVWSIDLSVSVMIFVIVMVVFLFSLNTLTNDVATHTELMDMHDLALETTETLIRTKGIPQNWNGGNVKLIGLSERDNVLDKTKVLTLLGMEYSSTKVPLGVGPYEYNLTLEHLNGSTMLISGIKATIGTNCLDSENILSVVRFIVVDNKMGKMRFYICD